MVTGSPSPLFPLQPGALPFTEDPHTSCFLVCLELRTKLCLSTLIQELPGLTGIAGTRDFNRWLWPHDESPEDVAHRESRSLPNWPLCAPGQVKAEGARERGGSASLKAVVPITLPLPGLPHPVFLLTSCFQNVPEGLDAVCSYHPHMLFILAFNAP